MTSISDPFSMPRWNTSALITIDVQDDFADVDGSASIPGTIEVVPRIAKLVTAYREAGRPIVHMIRLYDVDGSNAELSRRARIRDGGPIVAPGTSGSQLVEALRPNPSILLDAPKLLAGEGQQIGASEWILYKPRWGAFYNTSLESMLRKLDVDTVIVCGCNLPNCPRATLIEASERDLRIVAVSDATSVSDARGLAELNGIGASIATTAEVLELLAVNS